MIPFGNISLLMHSTDTKKNRGRESVSRNETPTLKPSLRRTKRRYAIAEIRKKIRIVEQKTVQSDER